VGGTRAVKVDVRIIAATNKDLHHEIEKGSFRKDLYYRLNVIPLRIPPLRERPEDIALLAEAFLRRHAPERSLRISEAAMERLVRHRWEGNARELENAIERALVLCSGDEIAPADFAFEADAAPDRASFEENLLAEAFRKRMTVRELTDLYIDRVLAECGGSKMEAARILGLNRRTLYRRDERALMGEQEPGEAEEE